jgi:hypothetical protein
VHKALVLYLILKNGQIALANRRIRPLCHLSSMTYGSFAVQLLAKGIGQLLHGCI